MDEEHAEDLLRRALIDAEAAASVALRVTPLTLSDTLTVVFHGRRDLGTVQTYVAGEPISKYKEADEQYDIWVRAEPGSRRTPQDVYDLTVRSQGGQLVRLGNLVRLHEDLGPAEIDRTDRQRTVTIVGNLLPSLPLATAVEHTNRVAASLDMPPLYNITWGGRAKSLAESNSNFGLAFLLSIVFMYMVLAAQFESFLHPITIMLALPLTLPFALLSLVLLREALNIYSMLGLFMLFGVVKKNGILQIDYTNTLRARGLPRDQAILQANRVRLRPILMTTLMLVVGMIPIALGRGPGSGSRGSLARVIIGGQALSLLITLLITPVAYSLFDDLGGWLPARVRGLAAWMRRPPAAAEEPEVEPRDPEPGPRPSAIGSIPKTSMTVVMRIGRSRTRFASRMAGSRAMPRARSVFV